MRITRTIAAALITLSALLAFGPVAANATPAKPSDPPWGLLWGLL